MILRKTILDLLYKLTCDFHELAWNVTCTYSDGLDENIYQITITETTAHFQKGCITFRLEDGRVINCHYKELYNSYGGNIIDTLLDIINLEKHLHRRQA